MADAAPFQGAECLGAYSLAIKPTLTRPVIPMKLHADNRTRLVEKLRADGAPPSSVVVLQGGETDYRHETDHEKSFRQESFFAWAFGVKEPDFYGSISVATGKSTLFVPRLPDSYAVVMGPILTHEQWKVMYEVDDVKYVDDLAAVLGADPAATLLLMSGFNTDGKRHAKPAHFPGIEKLQCDSERLWPAITECRVFKTQAEIDLLRYSAAITSEAHIAVMQHTTALTRKAAADAIAAGAAPSSASALFEFQLESLFHHWCYYNGGCRHMSYTCICAAGGNGAVLHYGHAGQPNSRPVRSGDMCLFDMGCEFHCYGSDITTSFPANGVFTADQRIVYDAVWAAVQAVETAMKPGVVWTDMHSLAYRTVLTHLKAAGLIVGEVEDMMAVNLGSVFMPHGLGHFLGIDTHDVGGYNGGATRPSLPGYASLRTTRVLQAGMYLTVEPGCYFIDPLLDAALADPVKSKFLVPEAIARFRGTGGVRIEDDVLVTADGCENFTLAPRVPEEVEAACQGKITSVAQVTKFL